MHDEDYPHLIGHDFHPSLRARRIAEVLAARDDHDVAAMARLQTDVVSLAAIENVGLLLERLGAGDDGERTWVVGLLASWDGSLTATSDAAAIYQVWCSHIARLSLSPTLGDELFRRLLRVA